MLELLRTRNSCSTSRRSNQLQYARLSSMMRILTSIAAVTRWEIEVPPQPIAWLWVTTDCWSRSRGDPGAVTRSGGLPDHLHHRDLIGPRVRYTIPSSRQAFADFPMERGSASTRARLIVRICRRSTATRRTGRAIGAGQSSDRTFAALGVARRPRLARSVCDRSVSGNTCAPVAEIWPTTTVTSSGRRRDTM